MSAPTRSRAVSIAAECHLTPDRAAQELDALAPKWRKSAEAERGKMSKALEKAEDVERVYAYCAELHLSPLRWLAEQWGMSDRSAQLHRRLYRERERLPDLMVPTVAFRILNDNLPDGVSDEIIALVERGVRVTVEMVETIIKSQYLVGATGAVADWLLQRNGDRPKALVADLKRIAELMQEAAERGYVTADGEDVALSALFTQAANDLRSRDADVELLRNEHFEATVVILEGRMHLVPVNPPSDLWALNGVKVRLIWRERADGKALEVAA